MHDSFRSDKLFMLGLDEVELSFPCEERSSLGDSWLLKEESSCGIDSDIISTSIGSILMLVISFSFVMLIASSTFFNFNYKVSNLSLAMGGVCDNEISDGASFIWKLKVVRVGIKV